MAAIAAREHEVCIRAAEAMVARVAKAVEATAVALCVEEEDVDDGARSNASRSPHRCRHAEWHHVRCGRRFARRPLGDHGVYCRHAVADAHQDELLQVEPTDEGEDASSTALGRSPVRRR